MQMNLHIKDMTVNFGNSPEMERINYWFQYANELCRTHKCDECPLVGYKPIQTDESVLRCETGKDKKPKGQSDEQRTGREADKTDQDGNDQSKK